MLLFFFCPAHSPLSCKKKTNSQAKNNLLLKIVRFYSFFLQLFAKIAYAGYLSFLVLVAARRTGYAGLAHHVEQSSNRTVNLKKGFLSVPNTLGKVSRKIGDNNKSCFIDEFAIFGNGKIYSRSKRQQIDKLLTRRLHIKV